jgi:hypothetical protein
MQEKFKVAPENILVGHDPMPCSSATLQAHARAYDRRSQVVHRPMHIRNYARWLGTRVFEYGQPLKMMIGSSRSKRILLELFGVLPEP